MSDKEQGKSLFYVITLPDREFHATLNGASSLCGKGLENSIVIPDAKVVRYIDQGCIDAIHDMIMSGQLKVELV